MDFAPYQLGEMIHPNLVVNNSHSSFDIFVLSVTSLNVHPAQLTLSPIHNHKNKILKYFLQKWLWHQSYAKIYVILSKCDNFIENIQIHMPWLVFFFGIEFLHKCEK